MEKRLKAFFAAILLLALPLSSGAQGKFYTRKVRLADFTTVVTKVVLGGQSLLDITLKDEISGRWRISPYEYCSAREYEKLKDDPSFYFLRLVRDEGVAFLCLEKGGREDDADVLKRGFEVVRIAISSESSPSGREFAFMGAFVDIMQTYVEDAMVSDRKGYAGLKRYCRSNLEGKTIVLDPDNGDELFISGAKDTLVGIVIAPSDISFKTKCYKMLISADTHQLYHYAAARYAGPADKVFSSKEIKYFERRNGVIAK